MFVLTVLKKGPIHNKYIIQTITKRNKKLKCTKKTENISTETKQ